ncbi:MAG: type I-E CRISPR-associated protein Cas5/CasD [Desulfomonilaceae bacterium]
MRDYLIFRLYGPMASWGDIAVGEYRPSFAHPTKSAIVGMVAASRGITRDKEAAIRDLADSYGFACRVDSPGMLLRDYHTVQVPSHRKGVIYSTRKDELSKDKLNTILSSRDYYCDALYVVCLWIRRTPAPYTLEELKAGLERPRFPLYLGRKSCPPALPLHPQVVRSTDLRNVLEATQFADSEDLSAIPESPTVSFYWEELPDAGMKPHHTIKRRDTPLNRRAWQFSERAEHYLGVSRQEER